MANYLYNGVELPKLPDWDKAKYPYALITVEGLYGWYKLYVFKRFTAYKHHPSVVDTPQWFTLDENADCASAGGYLQAFCKKGYDEWGELKSDTSDPTTEFIANIIWASVDIRDYNNALYLSASDPVPVPVTDTDHNARIMGWIVGKRLAAQRDSKKPVAYLYNGVRLPKLPEYDSAVYPFAAIVTLSSGEMALECYKSAVCQYVEGGAGIGSGEWCIYIDTKTDFLRFKHSDGSWTAATDGYRYRLIVQFDDVKWSDFDLINEDGSIYLAAAEPVPVYE